MRSYRTLVCLAALLMVGSDAFAQGPRGGRGGPGGRGGGGERAADDKEKIKPYDEVITDKAESDTGLFTVHRLDDKIYYEIPPNALDTEMLWVVQIEKTQSGFGYGGTGAGNRVVRWQKRGDNILLRDVKFQIRADVDDSVTNAVEATSVEPIIMSFPIKAWGKDQKPVIDVTKLFTSDVREFSAARRMSASGVDDSRTFIEEVKSFPDNIESKILMTYRIQAATSGAGQGRRGPRGGERRDPTQSAVTALIHHSMVKLPEIPMTPRVHDDRVGFFGVSFQDFGTDEHAVKSTRYIARWRLEKQDPSAEVSDPVKPIVFYIGRGVPDKWRQYVKKGIEDWQPAFAAAGFSNAIIAKDAPSKQEDPDWDAEDARISSIRWLPSTTENAMGPHVNDPRTGEILESDIIVYHNILKLVRDWYFTQASPNDDRAQQLPMPDELIGELLAYVITHEVGHTLGFPHNMKASSSYTVAQLRDAEFTKINGTEASIMDYGRFNYVAQPGDGAALVPVVGPYDFFAVDWGYRQYDSTDDEKAGLAALVAKQLDDVMLRFGDPNASEDPSQQTEDLGADTVEATRLGLLNLDRVAGYLVDASCKEGENYDLLSNMYNRLLSQRNRELGHVVNVVGGFVRNNVWFGDGEQVYSSLSRDKQREAVAFLNEHAFHVPDSIIAPDILQRLEATGAADRIIASQSRLLRQLVTETRVKRLAEHAQRNPDDAYTPSNLLADLRRGIWSETEETVVNINLYRRNLQRAHAEMLINLVATETPQSDLPALARGELEALVALIEGASGREVEAVALLHLKDTAARIDVALRGDATAPAAPATPTFGRGIADDGRLD